MKNKELSFFRGSFSVETSILYFAMLLFVPYPTTSHSLGKYFKLLDFIVLVVLS